MRAKLIWVALFIYYSLVNNHCEIRTPDLWLQSNRSCVCIHCTIMLICVYRGCCWIKLTRISYCHRISSICYDSAVPNVHRTISSKSIAFWAWFTLIHHEAQDNLLSKQIILTCTLMVRRCNQIAHYTLKSGTHHRTSLYAPPWTMEHGKIYWKDFVNIYPVKWTHNW